MPAVTVRVQRGLFLFFLVCATHFFPTLRPLAGSVNVNVTLAGTLRLKEKVVPRGSFFFLLEYVTVADVAAGKLPKDVLALTRQEEAWQTR